ncbi:MULTISPECIES: ASCH domain-containing protein [Mesorhizobium]|uniref:ASCH domain-containing protein n=1 Tax=Mesorhizobium album TaxID=3072314 RepID=A0ABU4Y3L2_9HYPH|nr:MULTISPECIES: ASCH domain-containing protein [Mesorhizobium]MDX8437775.1 ASCH domain-containing protein [Mesorhizobium abyssinicae]MDX8480908.1 ASCH domain-containing protein [Mesorhizobium sp. VK24D]MDX8515154.1 ASCH domain-containing protein [Mesorhizobium sp. VK23E]
MKGSPRNMTTPSSADSPPAVSIQQPWAELILQGKKSIEVRSWNPTYRGPVWLHTGLKVNEELDQQFGLSGLYRGGFVGRFQLANIIRFDVDRWSMWRSRHLVEGPMIGELYGWMIREPIRMRPIPSKGKLGLFHPEPEVQHLLDSSID